MIRIAYYSHICFSDVDLSYLSSLRKVPDAEVYYFIPVINGRSLKSAAISIDEQYKKNGVFNASVYPGISKYSDIIDIDKTFVVNVYGGYFRRLLVFFQLLLKLLKLKIDVLHITDFYEYYEFILYLLKKKTVLTVHDPLPHSNVTYRSDSFYRKKAFKNFKNFIILNKAQREEFVKYYRLEKCNVYNSSLGPYTYLKRYDDLCVKYKPYILYFGRITSYKGLDYLLPAMLKVHEKNESINLIVAGRGDFGFDISDYKKLSYIHFLNDFIPDNELVGLIKGSEFVVCPYTDATQSGVVMSSYTFNKVVVATRTGGLPEMLEDGRLGPLISPKSTHDIFQAILTLLDEPSKIKQYETAICEKYSGQKSWGSIVDYNMIVYKKIAKA